MFDPYHKWLGIPKEKQPATPYQLLGIQPGELDPEVIEEAAIRQSTHLRGYQLGPHAALCTQLLNEIAAAKTVLLNPAKRSAYEAQVATTATAPVVQAPIVAVPVGAPVGNAHQRVTSKPPAVVRMPVGVEEPEDEDFELDPPRRRRGRYASIARSNDGLAIKVIAGVFAGLALVMVLAGAAWYFLRAERAGVAAAGAKQVAVKQAAQAARPVPAVIPKDNVPQIADPPAQPKPAAENGRFLDRGDYVEDTQTRLCWQKDGTASGKMHYYDAIKYATLQKFGGEFGWRVPTKEELAAIFPAVDPPFTNTKYNPEPFRQGPGEWDSYWTSNLDPRLPDNAYIYHWYAKGGTNNCLASRNFAYVRCVHDPIKK